MQHSGRLCPLLIVIFQNSELRRHPQNPDPIHAHGRIARKTRNISLGHGFGNLPIIQKKSIVFFNPSAIDFNNRKTRTGRATSPVSAANCCGASVVEFAIALVILVLLTAGVVNYGTTINDKQSMQDLTRNTVRGVAQLIMDGDPAIPTPLHCRRSSAEIQTFVTNFLTANVFQTYGLNRSEFSPVQVSEQIVSSPGALPTTERILTVRLQRAGCSSANMRGWLMCSVPYIPFLPPARAESSFRIMRWNGSQCVF